MSKKQSNPPPQGERPPPPPAPPEKYRSARDRQVVTATLLQLIQVVERWRDSPSSLTDELIYWMRTEEIKLPDTMIVARRDAPRRNDEVELLKARIEIAREKMNSGLDLEQAIEDADEVLRGDADEYVRFVRRVGEEPEREEQP